MHTRSETLVSKVNLVTVSDLIALLQQQNPNEPVRVAEGTGSAPVEAVARWFLYGRTIPYPGQPYVRLMTNLKQIEQPTQHENQNDKGERVQGDTVLP